MGIGDLFKAIWENSNPNVRLEHLVHLSQSDKYKNKNQKTIAIIKNLAITDDDQRIVSYALSLLRKPEDFKEVLSKVKSAKVRESMIEIIENNFSQWGWDLELEKKKKFLEIFKNEELIEKIISQNSELWYHGIEKITNEKILNKIIELSIQKNNEEQIKFLIDYLKTYSLLKTIYNKYQGSHYPSSTLQSSLYEKLTSFPEYREDQEITKKLSEYNHFVKQIEETIEQIKIIIQKKNFNENPLYSIEYFSEYQKSLVISPVIDDEMIKIFESKFQELKKIFYELLEQKDTYAYSQSLAAQLAKINQKLDSLFEPKYINCFNLDEQHIEELVKSLKIKSENLFAQTEQLIGNIPEEMYSFPTISHSRDEYIAKKNQITLYLDKLKKELLAQKESYQNALNNLQDFLQKLKNAQENFIQGDEIDYYISQLGDYRDEWTQLWGKISNELSVISPLDIFKEQEDIINETISQSSKIISRRIQQKAIEHKKFISKLNQDIKNNIEEIEQGMIALSNKNNDISKDNSPDLTHHHKQKPYLDFQRNLIPYHNELDPDLLKKFKEKLEELNKKILEIQENINREQSINLDKRIKLYNLLSEISIEENKEKLIKLVKEAQIKWYKLGQISKKDFIKWDKKFKKLCEKILLENSDAVKVVEEKIQSQIQKKKGLIEQITEVHKSYSQNPNLGEADWRQLSEQVNTIIDHWKKIKILSYAENHELNLNFKNQIDIYNKFRNQYFDNLKKIRSKKLQQKKDLLKEITALKLECGKDVTLKNGEKIGRDKEWIFHRKKLISLNSNWQKIGVAVPFSENKSLDNQFYTIVEEILTRYNEGLEMRKKLKENLLSELTSIEKSLQKNSDSEQVQNQIKKLLEVKHKWDKIFFSFPKKYRKINNDFYSLYKKILDQNKEALNTVHDEEKHNFEKKQELLKQLEEILDQDINQETSKKIIELQQKWKEIGPVPNKMYPLVEKPFLQKTSWFFKQKRDDYKKIKNIRQENYNKKQKILICVRYLSHNNKKESENDSQAVINSPEKLKMVWEMNRQMGSQNGQSQKKKIRYEVKNLKKKWSEIGPAFSDKKLNDEFYGLLRNIKF